MISNALKHLRKTEGIGGANEQIHSYNEERVNKALAEITKLKKQVESMIAGKGK